MGNVLRMCGVSSVRLDTKSTFYRAYKTNEVMMSKLKDLGLDHKHLYALHQIFSAMDRGRNRHCVLCLEVTSLTSSVSIVSAAPTDNSGEINMMEFFTYIGASTASYHRPTGPLSYLL